MGDKFCVNCGTAYQVEEIPPGKSKFCKNCGTLLYKNENNNIVFNGADEQQNNEKQKNLEQEQLELDRIEKERTQQEQEKKRTLEQLEKEKNLKEKLEIEKKERLEREAKAASEKLLLDKEQTKNIIEEQVRITLEKIKKEEQEKSLTMDAEAGSTQKSWARFLKYPFILLVLVALAGLVTYYFYPEKILSVLHIKKGAPVTETATEDTVDGIAINTDSILMEQIRADLVGKEVLSWGVLKLNNIQSLTLTSKTESGDNNSYMLTAELNDYTGTKATAELELLYNKIILSQVSTKNITYKNTAPANSWFSFKPVPNCSILVNTNDKPIQCKSCGNCQAITITSTKAKPTRITNTQNILITSNTGSEAIVEFTYIPENLIK